MNKHSASLLRIAVLAGGDSSERSVSLASGRCVADALANIGHRVEVIDPAARALADVGWSTIDICFIALHGGAGEDGRVQRQLDDLGVRYTGSGPTASHLAMSKSASKERLSQARLPTLPYALVHVSQASSEIASRVAAVGYPVIVKPDSQGSSLGVSCAKTTAELARSLADAFRFDPFAIAEPQIEGREYTVAVIGRAPLPPIEISARRNIFSYEAKYQAELCHRVDPPDQPDGLGRLAAAACAELGTAGLARVDIMVDRLGAPWVLEINTVPGMTEHSLAPLAAKHAGLEMPALCDLLVRQALGVEVLS